MPDDRGMEEYQKTIFFPIGKPNDVNAKYFVGQSYLAPVSGQPFPIHNITFEPGCRNNWHIQGRGRVQRLRKRKSFHR